LKAKPVKIVAEREKMPFEVTPFVVYLTREQSRPAQPAAPATAPAPATAARNVPAAESSKPEAPAVAAESNDNAADPATPGPDAK